LDAGRYDEAAKYAAAALDSANRAAAVTSRLLAFGRRQSLDLKAVNVEASVRSVETLLHRTLGENVKLITKLEPGVHAFTDLHQLESALLNLTINSRDAMPHGGRITITTQVAHVQPGRGTDLAAGEYVLLSVSDTGAGMPPETLAKAFEPFFTTK